MKVVRSVRPPFPRMRGAEDTLLVVLTQDDAKLYACYAGYVPDHPSSADLVAYNGAKLNLRQAQGYFPNLNEKVYRR